MKFAILTKRKSQDCGNNDAVGFYQWLNVFQGRLLFAEDVLDNLQDGAYDLIHIRLTGENIELIRQLREKIGKTSRTKISISLDIPEQLWKKEFAHPDQIKKAVLNADLAFGANFRIAQALRKCSEKNIYEIPHPADLEKLRAYQDIEKRDIVTILDGRPLNVNQYLAHYKFLFGSNFKIRVLSFRSDNRVDMELFQKKNIEFIICRNEAEFCQNLAPSRFVLIPKTPFFDGNEPQQYENLLIYAAAMGVIVLGNNSLEVMRRCYPEIATAPVKKQLLFYWWLKDNPVKTTDLIETAKVRVEYYNWGNLQKRFLEALFGETKDERFRNPELKTEHPALGKQIHHIYGDPIVNYHQEELVVVCLVKNGAEYLKTFLEHYHRLGVKHFFFIDNGSTDGTIELLKRHGNTTIYQTELPHKKYECEIRRAVIEKHCRNNWCLCVDIDELFDYPFSNLISLPQFLRYLNAHHYTAVLSYLLDMFSKEMEFSGEGSDRSIKRDEDLVSNYCFYDISNIKKARYNDSLFSTFSNHNRLADQKMRNYSGGIRRTIFKNKESGYLLTKHPLIFVDSKIEPVVHPHFCNKAFVADVNGVLKHYKFIASFKEKVIHSLEAHEYCYYAEKEYQEYFNVIKDQEKFSLYSRKSEKLEKIEQLVRQGFLRVSNEYRKYLKSPEAVNSNR